MNNRYVNLPPASREVGVSVEHPPQPTDESWMHIISNGRRGNFLLPQAHFAQGILIAQSMTEQSLATDVPLSQFFMSDPPAELVGPKYADAKAVAHDMFDIRHSAPMQIVAGLPGLWRKDTLRARAFLTTTADVVAHAQNPAYAYNYDPAVDYNRLNGSLLPSDDRLIDTAAHDPLFQGLVHAAYAGLLSERIDLHQELYMDAILDFMQKFYAKKPAFDDWHAFQDYNIDRVAVHVKMTGILSQIADLVKAEMVYWASEQSAVSPHLSNILRRSSTTKLFFNINAASPHPLKSPY